MSHTKEPWGFTDHGVSEVNVYSENTQECVAVLDGEGSWSWFNKTADMHRANARRIVACVNACEGIDTDSLRLLPKQLFREWLGSVDPECDRIVQQRDKLLAAVKKAAAHVRPTCSELYDELIAIAEQVEAAK